MKILFSPESFAEYSAWATEDPKIFAKLNTLIRECQRTPFKGMGKPEPLKNLNGWWSRRITQEHRLVYSISGKGDDQFLEIAQCKYHYTK